MNSQTATTDSDIRRALHDKRLRRAKADPKILVIDELGLAHAQSRIDVAVINGCIHGYEIKSSKDTLYRLHAQMEVYRRALQKLTIVSAPRHVVGITSHVPDWCGVVVAERGPKGGIKFNEIQKAVANPDVDPVVMAHLLWKSEVIDLLSHLGCSPKELRQPRQQLYQVLCEALTLREIVTSIRIFMVQRQAWQGRLELA
jgi:hypothetical protein